MKETYKDFGFRHDHLSDFDTDDIFESSLDLMDMLSDSKDWPMLHHVLSMNYMLTIGSLPRLKADKSDRNRLKFKKEYERRDREYNSR